MDKDISHKLWKLKVGGCTCMTKTPEIKYHKEDCQYRMASEIEDYIEQLTALFEPTNSKKVFVWVAHGDISVYDVSTIEQLAELFETITECLVDWNINDKIDTCRRYLDKEISEQRYRQSINTLLNAVGIGNDEQFEYGTGFTTLRDKIQ